MAGRELDVKKHLQAAATSLLLILIVASGYRAAMTREYIHRNPRQALAILPFLFESGNIASSLAAGAGFGSPLRVPSGPTAWMTPVYPELLGGVLRVFGTYTFASYVAAVALNALFSVLACVPIFYAGKRIGGPPLGAAAAWLWAIFPNAILLTFESLWDASLDALLGATILWATLAVADSRRKLDFSAYALLWGFALMANATLASLLPFLLGWIAYRQWKLHNQWLGKTALALAIVVLCCAPWTVRNYRTFHSWVPLRSVMGLQLWLGNNPRTTPIWLGLQHPIFDPVERQKYLEMGEISYMRQKLRTALAYMGTHPRRVAALSARRFIAVWSGGTSYPIRDLFSRKSSWFRWVLLFNIFAALGALLGIIALWRARSPYVLPLAVFPLVFPWPYYLTLVEPRYRLPIDPIVLLLTAIAARALFSSREGPFRKQDSMNQVGKPVSGAAAPQCDALGGAGISGAGFESRTGSAAPSSWMSFTTAAAATNRAASSLSSFIISRSCGTSSYRPIVASARAAAARTAQFLSLSANFNSSIVSDVLSEASNFAQRACTGAEVSLAYSSIIETPIEKGPKNWLLASLIPINASALGSCISCMA